MALPEDDGRWGMGENPLVPLFPHPLWTEEEARGQGLGKRKILARLRGVRGRELPAPELPRLFP